MNRFAMARDARRSMTDNYMISAPLIGQLGKNFANGYDNLIPGDVLLKLATDKVRAIQAVLGGKFVYLECEDKDALLNFYGDNGFVIFGKRDLDRDELETAGGGCAFIKQGAPGGELLEKNNYLEGTVARIFFLDGT